MKHKIEVVYLPTKDEQPALFITEHEWERGVAKELNLEPVEYNTEHSNTGQHVYVTISQDVEPIEDGDYWIYICPINGIDYGDDPIIIKNNLPASWFDKLHDKANYYKIIATTDPKLTINNFSDVDRLEDFEVTVPQLQQSFIKEYVANPDGEWEVEYDQYFVGGNYCNTCSICKTTIQGTDKLGFICEDCGLKLKLNQDNTVNITPIKQPDTYSREDVITVLKTYRSFAWRNGTRLKDLYKWVNKNL